MKITALEIRKKSFEKNFRGYDKEEVDAFLKELSEEWEKVNNATEELQKKLDDSIKEANKMKEVEASLFRTLKTAEDTGASIIEEANEAAEYIVREAHQNADAMLNDAKTKSQNLIETAESKAKQIMEELKNDVSSLVRGYETLVQQRELILKNLKSLSDDIQDNISVSNGNLEKINVHAHLEMVEILTKTEAFTIANVDSIEHSEMTLETKEEFTIENEEVDVSEIPDIHSENQVETEEESNIEDVKSKAQEIDSELSQEIDVPQEDSIQEEPKEEKNKGNKGTSFFDEVG